MSTSGEDTASGRPPDIIYHYTTQSGLLGIIEHREIWATHFRHLNDTQEFTYAWKRLLELLELNKHENARRALHALKEHDYDPGNCYVASFSAEPDSLPMWRAYAHSEPGFALGFNAASLTLPEWLTLVRCVYGQVEQRTLVDDHIANFLKDLPEVGLEIQIGHDLSDFPILAARLKHPGFDHEKEWRIVSRHMSDGPGNKTRLGLDYSETPLCFRNGSSGIIPYRRVPLRDKCGCFPLVNLRDKRRRFPLVKVVVGPCADPEQSCRSVRSLLVNLPDIGSVPDGMVITSDVPYRTW